MTRPLDKHIKHVLLFLFLLPALGGLSVIYGQTPVGGNNLNTYARVTSMGVDFAIVDDVSGFQTGDTVLVMQMKGMRVSTWYNYPRNGQSTGEVGKLGYYEFLKIELVEPGLKKLTFLNDLIGMYDVSGFVQVVKVRSFNDAVVTTELSAKDWDPVTGKGGVLAMIVKNKLTLNADINVSGKGFRGAQSAVVDGQCSMLPGGDSLYFHEVSVRAGRKGEGPATHDSAGVALLPLKYAKGYQYFSTGGGGGGQFSGGGGGALFTNGGSGHQYESCGFTQYYGRGGYALNAFFDTDGRIIMGGGGGSSGKTTGTGSDGGNGGGIILILADTIAGNGHSIKSDGADVTVTATGLAGAGGGGAGGTIVISNRAFDPSALVISADGGNGGNTENSYGSGGGGSVGKIWTSDILPGNVTSSIIAGDGGIINYPSVTMGGSPGSGGRTATDLKMRLNGFLFNSIVSAVTATQTDSICWNYDMPDLKGTSPVGGTLPYLYLWQKSTDQLTWNSTGGNTRDLINPGPEADTIWYRRVVTDSNATPLSDTSKAILIIVQPLITDNLIGTNDTVCYGQTPVQLLQANAGPLGGNGTYAYQWLHSTDQVSWDTVAAGTGNGQDYQPQALFESTYFRRQVISGRCYDTTAAVTEWVYPLISSNTIGTDQVICNDQIFADLTGSLPAGGNGTYAFLWESSTDNLAFNSAEGITDQSGYNPDENSPNFPGDQYYRRIVKSGYNEVCKDTSDVVHLKNWPDIGNNTISADQTICAGNAPMPLTGLDATGGDGTPLYQWQDSTRLSVSFTDIAGATSRDFTPPALVDTTWYRRIVISSACDDTSNVVVINVHPNILNNSISVISGGSDTTICNGQLPDMIAGEDPSGGTGIYFFEWLISYDHSTWNTAPGVADQRDYSPETQVATCWLKRKVTSGECFTESNEVTINVLSLISNNTISSNQTICYNTQPALLAGSDPAGGEPGVYSYQWIESDGTLPYSQATGTSDQKDYQPPVLTVPMNYRRIVTSGLAGCCVDTSDVLSISINPLPTGTITVVKDSICSGENIQVDIDLTGTAPWDIVLNDAYSDVPVSSVASSPHTYSGVPENTSTDPSKTYDYSLVSVTDANGCVATSMNGVRTVVVFMNPSPDAGTNDEICGLDYTLSASPSGSWGGTWSSQTAVLTAVTDVSNASNPVTVQDYGIWQFWWKESNWKCVDSASVDITFWEQPAPAFAGNDTTLVPMQYQYDLQGEVPLVGTGTWSVVSGNGNFDDINLATTTVRGLLDGMNIFNWKVENGTCTPVEDDVSIEVTVISVPNGFSPNGDNINDLFIIKGIENSGKNELVITDMTGIIVYKAANYQNDWDGRDQYGNYLPEGTYYYFLTVEEPARVTKKGYVIIKRRF